MSNPIFFPIKVIILKWFRMLFLGPVLPFGLTLLIIPFGFYKILQNTFWGRLHERDFRGNILDIGSYIFYASLFDTLLMVILAIIISYICISRLSDRGVGFSSKMISGFRHFIWLVITIIIVSAICLTPLLLVVYFNNELDSIFANFCEAYMLSIFGVFVAGVSILLVSNLSMSITICQQEKLNPLASIRRNLSLSKGFRLYLFIITMLSWVIVIPLFFIANYLYYLLPSDWNDIIANLAFWGISAFSIFTMQAVFYHYLINNKDNESQGLVLRQYIQKFFSNILRIL